MDTKYKNLIKLIIKLVLIVIVFYFISKQITGNWNEIINYDWSVNYFLLLLSFIAHIVTFLLFSKVWCYIIGGFGYKVSLKHGFKLAYIGNLGRYLPGKVWAIFGMAYLAKRLNIKEEESIASWVIAVIFSLPTAFLLSFLSVILFPELLPERLNQQLGISIYILASLTLIISFFLIIAPEATFKIFNKFLKFIKRPPVNFKVSKKEAFKIYMGYFLSWLIFGISFWIFLHAVVKSPEISFFPAVGAYVFAYQIGFVAIFTPGGIGVREFALWSMLEPSLGSIGIGIAVAARLWNIIAEVISAIIAFSIKLPKPEEGIKKEQS